MPFLLLRSDNLLYFFLHHEVYGVPQHGARDHDEVGHEADVLA